MRNIDQFTKEYLDHRINELNLRYQQRYDFSQEALKTALEVNNRRLDQMNEFRASLTDVLNRTMSRAEVETALAAVEASSVGRYIPLAEKVSQNSKTNWPMLASLATVMVSVVIGVWVIVGLKIDTANQPLILQSQSLTVSNAELTERLKNVETGATASSNADNTSRSDRAQLNQRLNVDETTLQRIVTERQTAVIDFNNRLITIENQFPQIANMMNLLADRNYQMISILYDKAFPGQHMPQANFKMEIAKKP